MDRERPRGVQIRHLVVLAAIARTRSFRAASSELGYVQSAVSQQVAELERWAGTRLLERSTDGTPVRLTYAGRVLLVHAEEILARMRAARADVAALTDSRSLRVGLQEGIGVRIMPALLQATGQESLRNLSLREPTEARLFEQLAQGELELGFADLPLPVGPFECVELLHDPLLLLVPSCSPLADRQQPPTLAEIAELPLIVRSGSRVQERVEAALCAHGRLRVVQRVRSDTAVRALVAAAVGAAVLPRLSVEVSDSDTVPIDLTGVLARRVLTLAWHRSRRLDAAAARFRAAALDVCRALDRDAITLAPLN